MEKIVDLDVQKGIKVENLVEQMYNTGFQATHLAKGVKIIEKMIENEATIFLSFTANMVASGLRSIFAKMCKKKIVDIIITTGGAIEHDFIRSFKPYVLGDFNLDDKELRKKDLNRIGNIIVPTNRYVLLEKKIQPLFERLYKRGRLTNPSEIAYEMGKIIKDKQSFLYWASKNHIPVFSPGITDSAIGLQSFFFKQEHPDFGIDVTGDMKKLADLSLNAEKTGGIILGGGISKHHVLGANLLRGGLDYAVYITTATEFDGSLSGARTKEAVSWGKINKKANHITVNGDATIVFPLIIAKFL
ncbi:MAG: deoxyhypusine synthase [Candidatus Aenigmarchaeota archaeon]|nr:deoxyhypusine synthase [Candidatus Aenigmarchaeota archaeon]